MCIPLFLFTYLLLPDVVAAGALAANDASADNAGSCANSAADCSLQEPVLNERSNVVCDAGCVDKEDALDGL